jgi:hypothetical protein
MYACKKMFSPRRFRRQRRVIDIRLQLVLVRLTVGCRARVEAKYHISVLSNWQTAQIFDLLRVEELRFIARDSSDNS